MINCPEPCISFQIKTILPSPHLQFDQMSVQASQYGDELRVVKGEVGEVNRLISRLQSEIEAVKAQVLMQY